MLSRIRVLLTFTFFLVFWLLPAFVMHFTRTQHALLTTHDLINLSLLRNTTAIALVAVVTTLLLGLPTAYYLAYANFRFRNLLSVMLLLPLSIPPYVSAIGWLNITHYTIQGETFLSLVMAGLVFGSCYFPIIAILSATGFLQIEKRLEESARLTHKDRAVFFKISIPLARPFILSGAILVFLFVVLDYGVPDFFMIPTYSIEIFTQFSLHNLKAAVIATYPLLLVTIALAIIEALLVRGSTYIPEYEGAANEYRKKSRLAPILIATFIIASAGIPITALIKMAGGFSNYTTVIRSSAVAFGNTILFGLISGISIILFGFIWAHLIDTSKRGKTFLKCLSNVNLGIPGALIAISLIMMWNRSITIWIYHTILIIIICNFARFSPIAFKVIMAPFTSMSPHLKDLNRMISAGYVQKIRRIFIPLCRNGLLFGFVIAFLFSVRELESTLLILPPGKETIPIRIFSLIHYGAFAHVAVLSLGLVLIGFTVSLLVLSFMKSPEAKANYKSQIPNYKQYTKTK
jgi:iron(III) transport system permease protein